LFSILTLSLYLNLPNPDTNDDDQRESIGGIGGWVTCVLVFLYGQLTQAHVNDITAIHDKAEKDKNAKVMTAENQFNSQILGGLTQVLMGHKSFASMMDSIGNQVVAGLMQNALKTIATMNMTTERQAAAAARDGYLAGMKFPFPANIVMAPSLAAIAFSTVSGFAAGTDGVPGFGTGDKVPAMLEPGEGVVPGGVMDGLRSMARSGNMGGGTHMHAHVNPTYNLQALDTDGMQKVLDKHNDTINKHVTNTLRKMNR
jgi:hypothetical protein